MISKRWSFMSLLLVFSLVATSMLVGTTDAFAKKSEQPSLEEAVVNAMIDAKKGTKITAEMVVDRQQVNLKRFSDKKRWVFGSSVITAPNEEDMIPEGWLFIAHLTKEGWDVGLDGSDTFKALVDKAPASVVSKDEKETFLAPAANDGELSTQAISTGLQLPWSEGASWYMNGGPHGWAGYDTPYSSADFSGGDEVVRAAESGNVYTMCSNNLGWLRIYHDNGYTTDYYHLWDNIQPTDGSYISKGAFLGYTGTDVSCGGSASGRHVHFALRSGGAYVALNNKTIGGWTFYEGSAYNGYAVHGSTTVYPGGALYNYGTGSSGGDYNGTVDANGGSYVNLRSGPGTNYSITGSAYDGEQVLIVCTARGTSHTGRWGTTDLWDKLDTGDWISDAFVYTGTNDPIAPSCY